MRDCWSQFKEEEEEEKEDGIPIVFVLVVWFCIDEDGWKSTKTVSPGLMFARSSSLFNAAPLRKIVREETKNAAAQFRLNSPTVNKPSATSMILVSELCCIVRTVIFIPRSCATKQATAVRGAEWWNLKSRWWYCHCTECTYEKQFLKKVYVFLFFLVRYNEKLSIFVGGVIVLVED